MYQVLYHDLFEICIELNEIFSISNALLTVHLTATSVFAMYRRLQLLKEIVSGDTSDTDFFAIFDFFVWTTYGLFMIFLIVYPCDIVISKVILGFTYGIRVQHMLREDILRWWGQEYPSVKKLDDLMPINVKDTCVALPQFIKNVTIYNSSFKIKFQSLPFLLVTNKTPNSMVIT